MTDIVEQLRAAAKPFEYVGNEGEELSVVAMEAADEIERLLAVLRKVVPDLTEIVRMPNAEHIADKHNEAVRRLKAIHARLAEPVVNQSLTTEVERQRNDLLAIIHRDGGHYREKHGDEKAFDDAVTILSNEHSAIFEASHQIELLRAENATLREMVELILSVPSMTDAQLVELQVSCRAAIEKCPEGQ